MTWEYKAGAQTDMIDVYVDSDWAEDRQQRKSTSGGLVIVGGIVVKSWSRTHRGRSLSSAEAEYYAIVTGAAEVLAVQALAEELGWKMSVRVHSDSFAAKAVASRPGLGKLRHIELKYLWVQELVQEQRDHDQEDQWTRQSRRLSDQAKGLEVLRTLAESFRSKMEVIDYPKV